MGNREHLLTLTYTYTLPPHTRTHDTFELQVKYYSKISYAPPHATPSRCENLLDQVLERANHAFHPPHTHTNAHTRSFRALKKCEKRKNPFPFHRHNSTSASNYIKKITRNSAQLQLLVKLNWIYNSVYSKLNFHDRQWAEEGGRHWGRRRVAIVLARQ